MYGEWMAYREDTRRDNAKIAADTEASAADKAFYFTLMRQVAAQKLYNDSSYCAPEILAAIARDELRLPEQERWPRYCSPINPVCRFAWVDLRHFQARLLNANRYLRAFEILKHPDAPLPSGYQRVGNHLSFTLHPESAKEGARTITLPLPGSRL